MCEARLLEPRGARNARRNQKQEVMAKKTKSGKATAKPVRARKAAARKPKTVPKRKTAPKPKAKKPKKASATKAAALKAKTARVKSKPKTAAKPKPAAKRKVAARPKASVATKRKPTVPHASTAMPQASKPQSLIAMLEAQSLKVQTGRDWSETLFLPKTDFPMKAGLPEREPELLKRWERLGLYEKLRADAKGRATFVLHDGPPYANGHIHIGTGLNKILKDVIVRSRQMTGKDANYVPGWDCHGLPIEWKVEEENYRARGRAKPDLSDSEAMIAFRAECRAYAEHWLNVQREEFKRLGALGDWAHPYTTMSFDAEATIAAELLKFAMNGLLYRGSKPVMWSVVERTALAEAEVEYEEIESPAIYVKFPVVSAHTGNLDPYELLGASIVIWTTTPWTIPGNRAISYSPSIKYGLYEVTAAPEDNWAKVGERLVLADALAENVKSAARIGDWKRLADIEGDMLRYSMSAHPLRSEDDYLFNVPLLPAEHVTEDTGTGFVHTAPGHGVEDFEVWTANERLLRDRKIDTSIPFTVDEAGFFTKEAPGFEGKRVIDDKGKFGDANFAVIAALSEANALIARARHKHDYPHSWRSKKPVIFRATPQWFIAMDKATGEGDTLRRRALKAIADTDWVPPQGENRITGMVETRPDWVVSRQRAWGVPISVFVHKETSEVIPRAGFARSGELIERIVAAFAKEGADAWFKPDAKQRFLEGFVDDPSDWEQVTDILESGSIQARRTPSCLRQRPDLKWPADLYLEGSDQHRGWFQSSLLEVVRHARPRAL